MKWIKEAEIIKLLKTGKWGVGFHVVPLQHRKSYWIQSENQYKSIFDVLLIVMLSVAMGASFGAWQENFWAGDFMFLLSIFLFVYGGKNEEAQKD